MLNVGQLNEGVVLDHIEAGKSMSIYHYLKLDQLDCCVAIIKNARSNKMGKKDIIKIEGPLDIDLNVLGVLDPNLTINIIKDNNIVAKHKLELPETVTGIIRCKNPRCITSIEHGLDQVFVLSNEEKEIYRCRYCDEKYHDAKLKSK